MGGDEFAKSASSAVTPLRGGNSQKPPLRQLRSAATPSATPSGTPRAGSTRPRTQARAATEQSRTRLSRASGGGSEPSSPRGQLGSRPSSVTSEGGAGGGSSFEELLSSLDDSTADNVKVIVRVRPLSEREKREADARQCVAVLGDRSILLSDHNRPEPFTGTFDRVLGPETTQEDVYKVAGQAIVESVMGGFNNSIFAYGQTGAGKTYTMQGAVAREEDGSLSPQCGLILRVIEALFQRVSSEEQEKGLDKLRFSIKCSALEIYNEVISDLLRPSSTGLQIRDGDIKRGVFVEGLSEQNVVNADDVIALMRHAASNRKQEETKMNRESSRSHSVFTCTIEAHERTASGLTNIRFSKLNLIDLAGSERVGKSGATGERLMEAQNINKSLTTLGRVISALVERQRKPSTHVPYRDSRLTFLLQESLGGNSKTCIIANVSPSVESAQETHSTLLFAAGAKKIKNKAVVNEDTQGDMRTLQLENARLARLLEEARAASEDATLREELESQVASMREQLQQAETRNSQLATLFDQSNQAISHMQAEHAVAKKELSEAKAAAARLTEDTVALRSDNHSLSSELAQQRESFDREVARLQQDLSTASAKLRGAEESTHALRREGQQVTAELEREREQAALLRKELEEERELRREAQRAVDASAAELRRVRRQAEDDRQRAEAQLARLQEENEEMYQNVAAMRGEMQAHKSQLMEALVTNAKYRRMASEIGNLVHAVQAASTANSPKVVPQSGAAGGQALQSPAANGASRPARLSLAGLGVSGAEQLSPLVQRSPLGQPSPLAEATNRSESPGAASLASSVSLRSGKGFATSPAGRSPLSNPVYGAASTAANPLFGTSPMTSPLPR